MVLLHQRLEERQRVLVEIVHLLRLVLEQHHHSVVAFQPAAFAVNAQQTHQIAGIAYAGNEIIRVVSVHRLVFYLLQLDDLIGIHGPERTVADGLFLEGISFDPFELDRRLALVVGPVELLPDRHAELAGTAVAQAHLVSEPATAVPRLVLVGGPQLERTEQAQAKADVVLLGEVADKLDFFDVLVHIGRKPPLRTRMLAVLAEKFVERENHLLGALFLALLADVAQTGLVGRITQRKIEFLVGIHQIVQLLVARKNQRLSPEPRPSEQQGRQKQDGRKLEVSVFHQVKSLD